MTGRKAADAGGGRLAGFSGDRRAAISAEGETSRERTKGKIRVTGYFK
jgi:hypothetical protein